MQRLPSLPYIDAAQGIRMTKGSLFAASLLASVLIHLAALISVSRLMGHQNQFATRSLIPISLLEPSQETNTTPARDKDISLAKKFEPVARKPQHAQNPPLGSKREQAKTELPPPAKPKEETAKPSENKVSPTPMIERAFPELSRDDGGGSAAGASIFSDSADNGVVPGSGTAGGGGTAVAGLGRGGGAPGLPAPAGPLRTNREAKPIQTVRAVYPPMALRMGMESDVTLKIEVDPDGKVTRAEITKSGGAGFDEEALKAVQQSRFAPAQKDGQNVPAAFTYVYRFRLQK
jgi:TonB family protein